MYPIFIWVFWHHMIAQNRSSLYFIKVQVTEDFWLRYWDLQDYCKYFVFILDIYVQ